MGPRKQNPQGVIKMNATTPKPQPKPAGEQAISTLLYAQIRQAIAELKR